MGTSLSPNGECVLGCLSCLCPATYKCWLVLGAKVLRLRPTQLRKEGIPWRTEGSRPEQRNKGRSSF